jgi:hypothetical protein
MTVPAFTVPSVSNYLLTTIQEACASDSLYGSMLIILGEPSTNTPNDIIAIGATRLAVAPRSFIGSGAEFWLNEVYTVDVDNNTWLSTGDADDTSTIAAQINNRAWQLATYVSVAVRDDPSLGGLVNQAYPSDVSSTGVTWSESNAGGLCVGLTVQIRCEVLH